MIALPECKGLKYPDEFVIKFFFKENLHHRKGRVFEMGCANGNNLMLFFQYGWDCIGVDIDVQAVADAEYNLGHMMETGAKYRITPHDLNTGLPPSLEPFDVLLLPNVLCYIPRLAAMKCLKQAASLAEPGGFFFLRMRSPRDYRYKRGREVEANGFVLDISETGERGSLVVFYEEYELVEMLQKSLAIEPGSLRLMHVTFDNFQNGCLVKNDDIVLWGRLANRHSQIA